MFFFQVATGILDLEHTVTDVIEGKEYLFSVIACNKCGAGEPAYIDEPVNISSPASESFFTCLHEIGHFDSVFLIKNRVNIMFLFSQLFLILLTT